MMLIERGCVILVVGYPVFRESQHHLQERFALDDGDALRMKY